MTRALSSNSESRPNKAARHAQRAIDCLAYGESQLTDAAMSLENALKQIYEAQKEMRVRAVAANVITAQTGLGTPEALNLYQRIELAVTKERGDG